MSPRPLKATKEWLQWHRQRTKEGMNTAEVRAKLRKKRRPMSQEAKRMHSDSLLGKKPKNFFTHCFPSVKGRSISGWLELDGRRIFMMSIWERNVARYLQWLKEHGQIAEWEYEPERFIFHTIVSGSRTYRPDFRVTRTDGSRYFIEVKGWMDPKSATKLKRMKKYYPMAIIELLGRDRYKALSHQCKGMIAGWETDTNLVRAGIGRDSRGA